MHTCSQWLGAALHGCDFLCRICTKSCSSLLVLPPPLLFVTPSYSRSLPTPLNNPLDSFLVLVGFLQGSPLSLFSFYIMYVYMHVHIYIHMYSSWTTESPLCFDHQWHCTCQSHVSHQPFNSEQALSISKINFTCKNQTFCQ
jgi:hypothetical protein